jgi:hypothetical protein
MKHIWTFVTILAVGAAPILAQSPRNGVTSPKEIVQEFWKMEMGGGRLSTDGWNRAAVFFVHTSPPPQDKVVTVTVAGSNVDETARTGSKAEVYLECTEAGRIDSMLRFKPSAHYSLADKMMCKYSLTFTDKHWERGLNGGALREVTGQPEWRITEEPTELRISVATAVRYVTEMRGKTKDPAIQKNADEALAGLSRFR